MQNRIRIEHWKIISTLLAGYDFVSVVFAYFIALWLRFDCSFSEIDPLYLDTYFQTIFAYAAACLIVFYCFHLYRSIWRFASYNELIRMIEATVICGVISILLTSLTGHRMPISYYFFGIILQFVFTLGIRFTYRLVLLLRGNWASRETKTERVMIVGAGSAGQLIFRDIKQAKETDEEVVCMIDDNPNKWKRYIDNVLIYGGRNTIPEAAEKYKVDKIYICIPSASAQDKREVLRICDTTSCEIMNLPGVYQLTSGDVTVNKMKPVKIEDLLGRDPIEPDMTEVFEYISGKVVLITGVGSIGSELARQIASHSPEHLILFDIYENNAYAIQMELKRKYPELNLDVIIGSVRDSRKIFSVFKQFHPDIVYHAAAHKHVPLMEDSPCEAIKNNVIGTYKTAYAAMVHGCQRFVLISTDKAVNPTNIMGASKRLCEMVIQAFDAKVKQGKAEEIPQLFTHFEPEKMIYKDELQNARTEFVAVRFGNVLGSNGSVVPLFRKQIEEGGPVTVTHPDIIRYFMTIPEAVSLVLLAGADAKGGEIFVLDMGEPVKIDTMARNMIRLSGFTPDVDIKIEYCGLRPGEKLFEEKLMAEEGLSRTKNKLIHIGRPIPFDTDQFLSQFESLMKDAYENNSSIRDYVAQIVTTYHPVLDDKADNRVAVSNTEPHFDRSRAKMALYPANA